MTEKQKLWEHFPLAKVAEAVEAVWTCYQATRTVYACGNGGNAAFAANMTNDFSTLPFMSENKDAVLPMSVPRLRAINLCDSPTIITALLNDLGPDHIFSEQLKAHTITKGDVLFSFSGSGNSQNILAATTTAIDAGATTIGITRGTGGKLKEIVDIAIVIPGSSTFPGQTGGNNFNFHFEDALSSIAHMIAGLLRERVQDLAHARRTT